LTKVKDVGINNLPERYRGKRWLRYKNANKILKGGNNEEAKIFCSSTGRPVSDDRHHCIWSEKDVSGVGPADV
jgi:hypothetical protein